MKEALSRAKFMLAAKGTEIRCRMNINDQQTGRDSTQVQQKRPLAFDLRAYLQA